MVWATPAQFCDSAPNDVMPHSYSEILRECFTYHFTIDLSRQTTRCRQLVSWIKSSYLR
jgi:hypothetical protein